MRFSLIGVGLLGVALQLALAADHSTWPQWRGPNRDGIAPAEGLVKSWKDQSPPLLWSVKGMGRGFASPSIVDGFAYTTGEANDQQFVIALKLASPPGSSAPTVAWQTPISKGVDVGYRGSRCTPTIDGNLLFATSTTGEIACLDRTTGKIVWSKNMAEQFGGKMMSVWGFSESPLIDGNKVVITPGGDDAAIVALDKKTGEVIWKSAIKDAKGAAYSSLVVSEGAGIRQYVTLLGRGLVSVDAKDGKLLWTYDKVANGTANIPTPIVKGDYVFASTGYQTGAALVHLEKKGDKVNAKEVYFLGPKVLQNHHGGMVLIGDYLYGGNGHNEGNPICVEFLTGKVAWRERRGPGTGSAAVTFADGNLYFRYENGIVALIKATPEGYQELGTFEIPEVNDPSWPHPVIADGLLFLREQDSLHCYDLRPKK